MKSLVRNIGNIKLIDVYNLVIHEFAQKLDMQNGEANYFPPLHPGMDAIAWIEALSAAFEDFQHQCSRGKNIGIDCYGSTSPVVEIVQATINQHVRING